MRRAVPLIVPLIALSLQAPVVSLGAQEGAAADSLTAMLVPKQSPAMLTDILVVGSATGVVTVLNPAVRHGFFVEGSAGNIVQNVRSPIRRAVEGGREDTDTFLTNYVAHPVSWGLMGFYLKQRGYSDWSALVFTQLHSMVWEYAIEGRYLKPSGKDLLTNLAGAGIAIAAHGIAERSAVEDASLAQRVVGVVAIPLRVARGVLDPESPVRLQVAPQPADGTVAVGLRVGR